MKNKHNNINLSKNRAPFMAWMLEEGSNWSWYTTLVDFDFDTTPRFLYNWRLMWLSCWAALAMGCNQTDDNINGPN